MDLNVHVNINVNLPPNAAIVSLLNALVEQGKSIMATLADLTASIAQINTETDTVAAELTALQAQISADITPDQADTINAALGGIVTRLQSIGSPAAPAGTIPPTAPTPPATTTP